MSRDLSLELPNDSNIKLPQVGRNIMTQLNKGSSKFDFGTPILSPAARRNTKSSSIKTTLEAIGMASNGSIVIPHDMEGAKEQRLHANRVFSEEMVQRAKEYRLKKAEDLEDAKKKIIAK